MCRCERECPGMGENRSNQPRPGCGLMLLDLTGKKILVTGIANNRSIAWGIAQQLNAAGAELGITYLPDEKGRFETKVRELTAPLEPSLFLPLNVQDAGSDGDGVC